MRGIILLPSDRDHLIEYSLNISSDIFHQPWSFLTSSYVREIQKPWIYSLEIRNSQDAEYENIYNYLFFVMSHIFPFKYMYLCKYIYMYFTYLRCKLLIYVSIARNNPRQQEISGPNQLLAHMVHLVHFFPCEAQIEAC